MLRYRAEGGLVPLLFGLPLFYIGVFVHFRGSILVSIGFACAGALLSGFGLRAALWRDRLILDLSRGQYARVRGLLWDAADQTAPIEEVDAIILSTELQGGGRGGTYSVWITSVRFRDKRLARLEAQRDESKARNLVQQLTHTLRLPMIDQTAEPSTEYAWPDVGIPPASRTASADAKSFVPQQTDPPYRSGIRVTREAGATIITLPRAGFRVEAFLVISFMSIFAYLGCRTLFSMVQALRSGTEHWPGGWLIGLFLALMGLAGFVEGAQLMWRQEWLRDEGDTFSLGSGLPWISRKKIRIEKSEILDISASPTESVNRNRRALAEALRTRLPFVGSWQSSVSILSRKGRWQLGAALSTPEQQWLAGTLRARCITSQ